MSRFAGIIAVLGLVLSPGFAAEPARQPQGPLPFETTCYTCHAELESEPALKAHDDIHFERGLSCHNCHGGDPAAGGDGDYEAAHAVSKGWRGAPSRSAIPEFCGGCHADANFMKRFDPHVRVDQLSEYRTSKHGQRHAQGDNRTAVCTDCHGVHGIRAIKDPRSSVHPLRVADTCATCHDNAKLMGRYGIAPGQVVDYRRSVHANALYEKNDLSAPTCNDCHGSHGAVPPGVESVANVCGSCHGREATLFRETEMSRNLELEACIQCMVCHSNHAVLRPTHDMLGVGPGSTCTGCHSEGDPEYDMSKRMGAAMARLVDRLQEAHELLDRAERAGVEVGPDVFELQKAQDQMVESRVLVHAFDVERFLKAAEAGIAVADGGVKAAQEAFAELRVRRTGLGLSLIVIIAVIIALALKIKALERGGVPQ